MEKGAKATATANVHKTTRVRAAVLGEGCFLAKGCVTETKRSHVTRVRMRTDDSHDRVQRKPEICQNDANDEWVVTI